MAFMGDIQAKAFGAKPGPWINLLQAGLGKDDLDTRLMKTEIDGVIMDFEGHRKRLKGQIPSKTCS